VLPKAVRGKEPAGRQPLVPLLVAGGGGSMQAAGTVEELTFVAVMFVPAPLTLLRIPLVVCLYVAAAGA
jgi:hypothetical protein